MARRDHATADVNTTRQICEFDPTSHYMTRHDTTRHDIHLSDMIRGDANRPDIILTESDMTEIHPSRNHEIRLSLSQLCGIKKAPQQLLCSGQCAPHSFGAKSRPLDEGTASKYGSIVEPP